MRNCVSRELSSEITRACSNPRPCSLPTLLPTYILHTPGSHPSQGRALSRDVHGEQSQRRERLEVLERPYELLWYSPTFDRGEVEALELLQATQLIE